MKYCCFIALLLALCVCSCESHNAEEIKMEKYATAYCDCMASTKLAQLNESARKEMQSPTQVGKVQEIFEQIEEEHSLARDCCRRLQRKYGNLKPEDMPSFKLKLQGKCSEHATKEDVLKEMLQY